MKDVKRFFFLILLKSEKKEPSLFLLALLQKMCYSQNRSTKKEVKVLYAMNEYGILTNKDRYTMFSFMNYTITFMTGKDLIRYEKVINIENGVLTVSCIGKVKKEYEDYIDLSYILSNLRMNPEIYLKGLKGVVVKNA